MNRKTLFFVFLAGILTSLPGVSQNINNVQMPELVKEPGRKTINVPDILGYQTLKCDFHIHTMFSDGNVWPTYRVDEAWNEGLDAIAITDHIEGSPYKQDVAGDDNSSYNIAAPQARRKNIILIKAGEITRSMPPGHFNALFIDDTNALDREDYMDAFEAASEQGAYIIWNHPGWRAQQPDTTKWWDIHTRLYEKGWLHAIEVFNEKEWYPIALDWCIEKDLAVTAATDIHGITSEMYNLDKFHRPMTLVLATERSEEAIREALFAKRTIAWFGHTLAGKEEYLKAFFDEAVEIHFYDETRNGRNYIVTNKTDVPFKIAAKEGPQFTVPANGEIMVNLPKNQENDFTVTNLFVKGTENLKVSLDLKN